MIPTNVGTGLVIGQFGVGVVDGTDANRAPDIIPLSGTITFVPSVEYLLDITAEPNPVTIMLEPIVGVLDDEGHLCTPGQDGQSPYYRGIELFANDDPDGSVLDWTWSVVYAFNPVRGRTPTKPPHSITVLEGTDTDLTKAAPVPSSPGIGTPQALALLAQAVEAAGTVAGAQQLVTRAEEAADRAEAPTDAMMASTTANPGSLFSGELVDVIDQRAPIAVQSVMGPVVNDLVATSIAADSTVANAAAAAVDANPKIELLDSRTKPISPADGETFRVVFENGASPFEVTDEAEVVIVGVSHKASDAPYRPFFENGTIPYEVDADGRTIIYDPVFPNGFTGPGSSGGGSAVTELHAFSAVGQSNMQGVGRPFGPDLDPEDPRIFQYGATRRTFEPATVPLDMHGTSSGISPATTFAREYLKTQPAHVGVLLIPGAHGGTGFTHTVPTEGLTWTKGAASDPANALYELSVIQIKEALLASVAAGYPTILKGILWHQGEGNGGLATATYSGYLDTLISDYRTELGLPDLPFVLGQMSPEGMEVQPSKYTVDRSHQETPARVQRTGFAPATMGGTNYNDTTHFSRIGIENLGREYAAAYRRALDNKPGFGPLQPQNVTATFIQGTLTVSWQQQSRRVTSYRVEYQLDGDAWIEVVRAWPMNLNETITGLTGKVSAVRVTCINLAQETTQFNPTLTPHITW